MPSTNVIECGEFHELNKKRPKQESVLTLCVDLKYRQNKTDRTSVIEIRLDFECIQPRISAKDKTKSTLMNICEGQL